MRGGLTPIGHAPSWAATGAYACASPAARPVTHHESAGGRRRSFNHLLQSGRTGRAVAIPDSCQAFGSPLYRTHRVRNRIHYEALNLHLLAPSVCASVHGLNS